MLKLTSALLQQVEVIHQRLHIWAADPSAFRSRSTPPSPEVLTGILILIDEHAHHNYPLSLTHSRISTSFEESGARGYLGSLQIADVTELFLTLESLVMRSGTGRDFEEWRLAWHRTLISWISYQEETRRVRHTLANLTPLTTLKSQRLSAYHRFVDHLGEQLVNQVWSYLSARGALPQQHVIHIDSPLSLTVARHLERYRAYSVESWEHRESTSHRATSIRLTQSNPLSCLTQLLSFLSYNSSFPDQFPLLNMVWHGRPCPPQYDETPLSSRRIWLHRELITHLFSTSSPLSLWIDEAQHISSHDTQLLLSLLREARFEGHPFLIVLMTHRPSTVLSDFINQLSTLDMTVSSFEPPTLRGTTVDAIQLEEWDQFWTSTLLGDLEIQAEQGYIQLWGDAFLALPPSQQLDLLSRSRSWEGPSLFDPHSPDHLRFAEAGWMSSDVDMRVMTNALSDYLDWLLSNPLHLRRSAPELVKQMRQHPVIQRTLNQTTSSDHQPQGILHVDQLYQRNWLKCYLDEPLNASSSINKTPHVPKLVQAGLLDPLSTKTQHVLETRLSTWGKQQLQHALTDVSEGEWGSVYQRAIRINEAASEIGDLSLLAHALYLESKSQLVLSQFKELLTTLALVHRVWRWLGLSSSIQRSNQELIVLIAQVGMPQLARALLAVTIPTSTSRESIQFSSGMISLQLGDWSEALQHFHTLNRRTHGKMAKGHLTDTELSLSHATRVLEALSLLLSAISIQSPHLISSSDPHLTRAVEMVEALSLEARLPFELSMLAGWIEVSSLLLLQQVHKFPNVLSRLHSLGEAYLMLEHPPASRGVIYLNWIQKLASFHGLSLLQPDQLRQLDDQASKTFSALSQAHVQFKGILQTSPDTLISCLSPVANAQHHYTLKHFLTSSENMKKQAWEQSEVHLSLLSHFSVK